ncbi:MAG: transporter substrate-binding domain-containing protein [Bermanella sp.]
MFTLRFCLATLLVLLSWSNSVLSRDLQICNDQAEWPPYTYYVREAGVANKSQLTGATKDLLDSIFKDSGINFSIKLLPWKRCLTEVSDGHTYEVFADASSNQERLNLYHRSHAIYKTTEGLFFSKKRFPNGLKLSSAADINQYKLCGLMGYNYTSFFESGVKKDVDLGVNHASKALLKLEKGRCHVFLSIIEPVLGAVAINQYSLGPDIDHISLPGAKGTIFYLWVSKNSPRAEELLGVINSAIDKLYSNGEADKIFKKYLPGGTAL